MLTQEFIDRQKARLEEMLADIRQKIANRPSHVDMDRDQDVDDDAREDELEIEHESQVAVLKLHEASILRALQRIADGEYGRVPGTDIEIPMDRLETMPDAESIIHRDDEDGSEKQQ